MKYFKTAIKTVSVKSFSKSALIEEETGVMPVDTEASVSVASDWFGRTESRDISVDTTITQNEETSEYFTRGGYAYTYDDTEDTASAKITSHSSSFTSNSAEIMSRTDNYEYDETGNITGIYRYVDGEKVYYYTYTYDEAGQLVRENILEDDKTVVYTYDVGGNIVSKDEYAYTLGEIAEENEALKTAIYEYADSVWADLLTGFTESTD